MRHLSTTITQNLRSYDVVGRYGGDEFIILFPDTDLKDSANTLKRLHHSITTGDFSECGGVVFTISAGLAVISSHQGNTTLEDLIARADKALYMSKERGRNCVTVLDDEKL